MSGLDREARLAYLGPRGLQLREFLDEFVTESDDPIAWVTLPHVIAEARGEKELVLEPSPPSRDDVRSFIRFRNTIALEEPGHPAGYHLVRNLLFEADGANHHRSLDPIMRRLGEPRRPPAKLRASRRRIRGHARRGLDLADRLFRAAHERGVWVPPDLLRYYAFFIVGAQMLAHAKALLDSLSPDAVVIAATANYPPRALVHAARSRGIPSVYFPHAPVVMDPSLNDLPTDYAGLRGPEEIDYYAEAVGQRGRLEVAGNPSIRFEPMPEHDPDLPPVLAPPMVDSDLPAVFELVRAAVDGPVLVAPHPRADHELIESLLPEGWEVWKGRTYELLRKGPPMVIQFTSGVSLEALLLGIPTIELRLPPESPITYPLIREPYVRLVSTAEELRLAVDRANRDVNSTQAREELLSWARRWCAPVGEEAADRGAALVARAASAPPPGAIWSAWPEPSR